MRPYAKITPSFWIGGTGRELRKRGNHAQLLALHLVSAPLSNMLGLYYLPKAIIVHETGMSLGDATKALRCCAEAGFCHYDEDSQMVWVPEMARFQVEAQLNPKDKRAAGIQSEYDRLPDNPFLGAFYNKYVDAFCMIRCRRGSTEIYAAPEARSKGLRSQEQEQEQEQEQDKNQNPTNTDVLVVDSAADDASGDRKITKAQAKPTAAELYERLRRMEMGGGAAAQNDADEEFNKPDLTIAKETSYG
ncbi:MAG: hypothetical protein V4634_03710 [Pseudomonadota bacterium]